MIKIFNTDDTRADFNDYFLSIAQAVAARSTCLSRKVGCVLAVDNRIVATGYNGPPPGIGHCVAHCRKRKRGARSGTGHDRCPAVHAEQNAIISCARSGTRIQKAALYCTHMPCSQCVKMIVSLDIRSIYFQTLYVDKLAASLLWQANWYYDCHSPYGRYFLKTD
jgi:dCMP deaminase